LLVDSVEGATGFQRRELLQRIASLWLNLGGVTEALVVVDRTLAEGATTADVIPLLERIAAGPQATDPVTPSDTTNPALAAQALSKTLQRATGLLRQHYESLGQAEDVVRLAARQVELTEGAGLRAKAIKDLKTLLSRTSKLSLEKARRRQLLRQTASACAARATDREPAIGLFAELFEEDPGDEAAAQSVEEYGALLEATAQPAKLAKLWEDQARVHAAGGRAAAQRACWERAAAVWRKQGLRPQAIAAYKEAAALDSESAFEGLAELHEQGGDWAAAVPALEWLYLHAPAGTRGQRVLRLAEGCVALDDRTRARTRLEEALEAGVEAERTDAVCDMLVGLYRRDGAWRPLAERLVSIAGRTKDADRKVALFREAADLLRSKSEAPAEAATLLEKAVQLRPTDPTIRPDLADVLEAVERWDRAIEVLKEQVALLGSQRSKERALTHRRLARAMARAGRGKDALADLRAAAEMLPAHPGVLHDLARTALEVGQLELAESTFRALLLALHHPTEDGATKPPHRAEVFLDLAEIAVRRSDQPRAEDLVDSAVDALLETGEAPERFDAILASRGRGDLLARAIERRVERSSSLPARAAALGALAEAWDGKLGRPEELKARIARHAARVGRELEHEGATDVAAWSALGSVHGALGDEAARAATDRRLTALLEGAIAKAEPGPARAKLRVGFARSLLGTPGGGEAAVAALTAALEDDPGDTAATELLASALAAAGRNAEARAAFERLLARRPDDATALERLASLAQAESDWDAAIGAYRRLLPLSAGPERLTQVASELADACEKAGRPDDARDALEQALGEAPESAPLMQRLAHICERSGDWTRLARLAESLRTKNPESVEAVLLWAHALRMLSRSPEAITALTAAIERFRGKRTPLVARLLVETARAHLAADELIEAFEHLKAAFSIDARSGEGTLLYALVAIDLDDERTAERALFAITGTSAKTDADKHLQATAFYHLAAMALTKGDGGKARRLATKALGIDPGLAEAHTLVETIDAAGSAVVPRSGVSAPSRPPERTVVTPRS
jgi:tetratricopeptide (TPR) repeat protein